MSAYRDDEHRVLLQEVAAAAIRCCAPAIAQGMQHPGGVYWPMACGDANAKALLLACRKLIERGHGPADAPRPVVMPGVCSYCGNPPNSITCQRSHP